MRGERRRRAGHPRIIVTAAVLLAAGSAVWAQEEPEEQEAVDRVSGRASVGYLATQGNTDSTNANAALRLLYALDEWSHEFDSSAAAASRDDDTTAEAYTFAYQARRDIGERAYLITVLDSQRDRFSGYRYQISESVGYGRRMLDHPTHAFSMEVGAGAQQATRVDGTTQDEAILRGSLRYRYVVNQTTSLAQDVVVESGATNTRTESLTELRARLFGNVGLVLSHRIRRNSNVLPGRHRTDTFSSVSLEYAF